MPISEKDLTVELHYSNGDIYPASGRIDIAAQRVDLETGTIEARAIFPNPDGILLPGQFVRIVIQGVTLPDGLVVPNRAVSQGPQGPSLFVIDGKGTAQSRPVRLGYEVVDGWIVEEGLQGGEQVIVDGIIRVRPGVPVRPVPADPTRATSQADAGSLAVPATDSATP